jgi:hypothetical protein
MYGDDGKPDTVPAAGLASVVADALSLLALGAFARVTAAVKSTDRADAAGDEIPRSRFARYGIATMLASLLAGALIGYAAVSLARAGLGAETVAHVRVIANLGGIATRVLTGWLAQRPSLMSWWTGLGHDAHRRAGLVGLGQPSARRWPSPAA